MSSTDSGSVLGAATGGIILPATASALTGMNYFVLLGVFAGIVLAVNVTVAIMKKLND